MSSGANFIDTLSSRLVDFPADYVPFTPEEIAAFNAALHPSTRLGRSHREIGAYDQGAELSIAESMSYEVAKETGLFFSTHYVAFSWMQEGNPIDMFVVDLENGLVLQPGFGEALQLDIDEREDVRAQILGGLAVAAKF